MTVFPRKNLSRLDLVKEDKAESVWSADQSGYEGAEPSITENMDDKIQSNSHSKESQEPSEDQPTSDSRAVTGKGSESTGDISTNFQSFQEVSPKSGIQRCPQQHDGHDALDEDSHEAKRRKLISSVEKTSEQHVKIQGSSLYQHIYGKTTEDYDVVWDAAKHEQSTGSLPPSPPEYLPPDIDATDEHFEDRTEMESVMDVSQPESDTAELLQAVNIEIDVASNSIQNVSCESLHTFFSSGVLQYPNGAKNDVDEVRDSLMMAVNSLQERPQTEKQGQEATMLWIKYEALVFSLSQILYDELRLILLPTKAARMKGDYRSGKRLNMRRIVPYIASNFQNDRIWLRRTKPSQREYQVLLAIDDSSSMHENQCKEMAYESLALISSALSKLDCGKLGVCRFGENVELLHPLEKPFSAPTGGFILQHLTFKQTRTNFVGLLQAVYSIFTSSLYARSGSQFEISQLLVVLSDGRGVFADGVQTIETAVRRLNDIGVFTVFVILDSLLKDSVVDIKVPLFSPGTPPLIQNYLELFPFSFYIVLREVKKMPTILGQALRQWFELISTAEA